MLSSSSSTTEPKTKQGLGGQTSLPGPFSPSTPLEAPVNTVAPKQLRGEALNKEYQSLKAAHEGHDDIHGDFASGSGEPCALCIHFAAYQLENNISKIKDESISYLSGFDLTTIEYAITRVNKCLPNEPTCRVNSVPVIKPLTVAAVVRSVPLTQ